MAESGWPAAPASPQTPSVEVSGWGRRLGAFMIDSLIIGGPIVLFVLSRIFREFADAGVFEGSAPPNEAAIERIMEGMMGELIAINFLGYLATVLYLVVMHGTLGKTLGKMAVGIKVIKDDGTPCDFGAAIKRAVVHPVGSIVPFVGALIILLNGLWPLWDEKRQSLGDKLGNTYVVLKGAI